MEAWLNLTMVDIDELTPTAQAAEAAGFAGVSLGDHLVFPQTIQSRYPYSADGAVRWRPADQWPDPWVAMAAMAAATTTLRFTTGVYVAPLRDPFVLGKALSTVARISNDRVIAGFGAGWMREEFDLVGKAFEARGARLDELIEVLRRLCSGEMVEFHGEFYDFEPVQMSPAPRRPIPIYVGGHNPAALRRAVRNDGWIGVHHRFDETAEVIDRLRAVEAQAGTGRRCPVMMNVLRTTPEDLARFAEMDVDAVVLPALGLPGGMVLESRLESIGRTGEAFRTAGV